MEVLKKRPLLGRFFRQKIGETSTSIAYENVTAIEYLPKEKVATLKFIDGTEEKVDNVEDVHVDVTDTCGVNVLYFRPNVSNVSFDKVKIATYGKVTHDIEVFE